MQYTRSYTKDKINGVSLLVYDIKRYMD